MGDHPMSEHRPLSVHHDALGWQVVCRCRWESEHYDGKRTALDAHAAHLHYLAERALRRAATVVYVRQEGQ